VERSYQLAGVLLAGKALAGSPPGMKNGRMIAPAEVASDRRQGLVGQLTSQVDRDLPWPQHAGAARE
jgi:hypothetical protein